MAWHEKQKWPGTKNKNGRNWSKPGDLRGESGEAGTAGRHMHDVACRDVASFAGARALRDPPELEGGYHVKTKGFIKIQSLRRRPQ